MKRFAFKQRDGAGKLATSIVDCSRRARDAAPGSLPLMPLRRGHFLRAASTFLLCALLSGCAMMSAEECQHADWYALGLKDGIDGRPAAYVQQRVEACAEADVAADSRRYDQGRSEGLRQYCRLENAFSKGTNGGSYGGVCPPAVDAEFRRRFAIGRAAHDAKKEVKRIEGRIEIKERDLRNTYKDEENRLREETRDEDRRRIRREINQRRDRLRAEIDELDRALRRTRDRLFDVERAGLHLR